MESENEGSKGSRGVWYRELIGGEIDIRFLRTPMLAAFGHLSTLIYDSEGIMVNALAWIGGVLGFMKRWPGECLACLPVWDSALKITELGGASLAAG